MQTVDITPREFARVIIKNKERKFSCDKNLRLYVTNACFCKEVNETVYEIVRKLKSWLYVSYFIFIMIIWKLIIAKSVKNVKNWNTFDIFNGCNSTLSYRKQAFQFSKQVKNPFKTFK